MGTREEDASLAADATGSAAEWERSGAREVSQLQSRLERQAENVRSLQNALADRDRELRSIHQSRFWKAASRYWSFLRWTRNVVSRLKRRTSANATVRPASTRPAPPPPPLFDVICFSIIDWGFRYQRPQQLASALAARGHRVFYLSVSHFLPLEHPAPYVVREIRPRVFEVTLRSPNFDVYSGVLGPQAERATVEALTVLASEHHIAAAVSLVETATWRQPVLRLRETQGWPVVYDCMDEWRNFPGISGSLLLGEELLVSAADQVIASSKTLFDKWKPVARATLLARNGADFDFFASASEPVAKDPSRRPVIGYFGAIAQWMDVGLVADLARARPDCDFVLVGGVFDVSVAPLEKLSNVSLPGQQSYELMPGYLASFDVCIIPFHVNEITAATDPVKFYEYLSQGKPVVTRRMPELDEYAGCFYEAHDTPSFIAAIDAALREDDPDLEARRIALARANSWSVRAEAVASSLVTTFPRVSIVIPTWNGLEFTMQCLASVLADTNYPNFEVIVVDNASEDGTAAYLSTLASRDPRIRIVLNDRNEGFAGAINRGLSIASGDRFVILNNDVVVPRGWLHPMVRHLTDETIGQVVSVTSFAGNEARIDVPYRELSGMEPFAWRYTRDHRGRIFDIAVAAMYCVGMRRDVWESVGPLDEDYEIGMFEDDDYSHRVRLAGFRVVCAEDVFVHHFGAASFSTLDKAEYDAIWKRNQQRFEQKWGVSWIPHQPRRRVEQLPIGSEPQAGSSYPELIAAEASKWSRHLDVEKSGEWNSWLDHPAIAAHWDELAKIEGRPWAEWIASALGRPADRALDLGCGSGGTSFRLHAAGAVRRVEGFDISPQRVEEAERRRMSAGIEGSFAVGDVNSIHLPPATFDLIVSSHSFHHFLELEHVMSEIAAALTDDGLFVLEEFVGPTQFQWTTGQKEVVRALLSLIPPRLRMFRWNALKSEEQTPSVAEVIAESPFESVRSGEIEDLFRRHFEVVQARPLGGTIQHLLYNGIVHNFREDDDEAMRFVRMIAAVEDNLIDSKALPSDFMLLVGRRRRSTRRA